MTTLSQIRRLATITAIGCVMALGWAVPAGARAIDAPGLPSTQPAPSGVSRPETAGNPNVTGASAAPATQSVARNQGSDWTLPIILAGGVVLVVVGTAGYARRTRTSRRVIA